MQMRCFTSMGPFLATDDLQLRRLAPGYSAPGDASPDPLLEASLGDAPPVPLCSESDRLNEGVEASEAILAARRRLETDGEKLWERVSLLRLGIRECATDSDGIGADCVAGVGEIVRRPETGYFISLIDSDRRQDSGGKSMGAGQSARAMTYGKGDRGEGAHWGGAWPEPGRAEETATRHFGSLAAKRRGRCPSPLLGDVLMF